MEGRTDPTPDIFIDMWAFVETNEVEKFCLVSKYCLTLYEFAGAKMPQRRRVYRATPDNDMVGRKFLD